MKTVNHIIIIVTAIILFTACGVSTKYLGKSYAPTSNIDIYMVWRDVTTEYEVMGYADATPVGLSDVEDAQLKLEELARQKGADAIVFDVIQTQYTSPVFETTEKIEKNTDGGYTKKIRTEEKSERVDVVKVTFIKYKR